MKRNAKNLLKPVYLMYHSLSSGWSKLGNKRYTFNFIFHAPMFQTANNKKTQRNLLSQPNNLEEGWTLCGVPLVFNMNRCKMQRSWRSLVGEQKHCYLGKSQCIYGQVMKLEFHCFTVICLWQMFEDSFFWLVTPISKYVM